MLSTFAFNLNLRRYIAALEAEGDGRREAAKAAVVAAGRAWLIMLATSLAAI
jgi:hypothetical protein